MSFFGLTGYETILRCLKKKKNEFFIVLTLVLYVQEKDVGVENQNADDEQQQAVAVATICRRDIE
jgi:hypothetical protein